MSAVDGGPAFPVEVSNLEAGEHQTGNHTFQRYGMTLRDYFEAKVLQDELACQNGGRTTIAQSVEAQLVPLTDKQIYDLWPSECMAFCEEAAEFARAIEAHHGIKPAGEENAA